MPALLHTFALPLIVLGLVFGVPRYFPATTEGLTDTYGTASTILNPIQKSPPESERFLARPAVEGIDPDPEGEEGGSSYGISPLRCSSTTDMRSPSAL
jgi:hypothetical protein